MRYKNCKVKRKIAVKQTGKDGRKKGGRKKKTEKGIRDQLPNVLMILRWNSSL